MTEEMSIIDIQELEKFRDFVNSQEPLYMPTSSRRIPCIICSDRNTTIKYMKTKNVTKADYFTHYMYWETSDHEIWHWIPMNEIFCGTRFHKAVIDRDIPSDYFRHVIKPCLTNCYSMEII